MRTQQQGQVLALFAGILIPLVLLVGLAVDGGYAYVQRRAAQNGSDLASLAGANQIAVSLGDVGAGLAALHDCDVRTAIEGVLKANGAQPILAASDGSGSPFYGGTSGPQYVSGAGAIVSPVTYDSSCANTIPSTAMGVQVGASRKWHTFFIGIAPGLSSWTASATSTARTGYLSTPPAGSVFPMGLDLSSFTQTAAGHFVPCPSGSQPASLNLPGPTCPDQLLNSATTPSSQYSPGQFGWLKFGQANNCAGYGLGMTNDGCPSGAPSGYLQGEIDGNSHGCCSAPSGGVLPGVLPADQIQGFGGHNGNGGDDCTTVIASRATYLLPVWDAISDKNTANAGDKGNDVSYHITGFAGFQITGCSGANSATGVWRIPIFPGPTTGTGTPGPFSILGVELVK